MKNIIKKIKKLNTDEKLILISLLVLICIYGTAGISLFLKILFQIFG